MVMSPVPSVALLSSVVAALNVTAPKVITSFELSILPARVTVPLVLSVRPPLKVNESPDALPKVRVPVFWKVAALVNVPPPLKTKS